MAVFLLKGVRSKFHLELMRQGADQPSDAIVAVLLTVVETLVRPQLCRWQDLCRFAGLDESLNFLLVLA